ncbi:hypothetical protein RRF57_012299 [Xylaria bambusicola]|uniref:Uncharacterized protein n=1 Tax=Xylaria bambusicola TaxID=326684 RepID=A0AAN7ZAT6_9PEZI
MADTLPILEDDQVTKPVLVNMFSGNSDPSREPRLQTRAVSKVKSGIDTLNGRNFWVPRTASMASL